MNNVHKFMAFILCLIVVLNLSGASEVQDQLAEEEEAPAQLTAAEKKQRLGQISSDLSEAMLRRNARPGDEKEYALYKTTLSNLEQQVRLLDPENSGVTWASVVKQAYSCVGRGHNPSPPPERRASPYYWE